MQNKKEGKKEKQKLIIEVIEKFTQLVAGGFGLVAALAWNDAIQNFFKRFFKGGSGLKAQFIYAIFITLLIVVTVYYLTRVAEKIKNRFNR